MKEENNPSNTMTATKRNYNIQIGRHFMKNVSPQQLKTIHQLIRNFREKEEGIPVAFAATNPEHPSPNAIFIAKDTSFDSLTRDFQTEYAIHVGDDSLTNISDKELMNLYFTLHSFLIHSEGLPEKDAGNSLNQTAKKKKTSPVEIIDTAIDDCLIHPCGHSPYLFRRVWITDKIPCPQCEYGLSTENGTIWDMSRQQLSALQEKIEDLLSCQDDKNPETEPLQREF